MNNGLIWFALACATMPTMPPARPVENMDLTGVWVLKVTAHDAPRAVERGDRQRIPSTAKYDYFIQYWCRVYGAWPSGLPGYKPNPRVQQPYRGQRY